ncbi:pH-sensitive chloride channel 2-like isoform X2 [Lycorma delicatula]|uniref:pH-sensitive chloride channel 2-like isoform X2 n=1 Tax=Lycorma delicatula TaxID=130591 RepID=UPI003F50EFEF
MCLTMIWCIMHVGLYTSLVITTIAMHADVLNNTANKIHLLSSTDVIKTLTHVDHYDLQVRPLNPNGGPLIVSCRVYVFFLKSLDAPSLQFKVHMLLQLRWRDTRLKFSHLSNHREIIGEKWLLEHIWAPHIYFANERDSLVMRGMTSDKDHLINILPEGDVIFTTRLKTTTICRMMQGKFPFDQQRCHLIMDSWRYNTSNVVLEWEKNDAALLPNNNPSLAEYYLIDMNLFNSEENCCVQHAAVNPHNSYSYSSLVLTFVLQREFGFYIMDYYVPSVILVILSWMTFWLEPSSIPARCLLGASTMLTFILLTSKTNSCSALGLHFKTNDVWFFGCTAFIFLSFVEFAFVNTIHRQELKKIKLKKATSKNILKTAMSPQLLRKRRSSSCPSSPSEIRKSLSQSSQNKNNFLTVDHFQGLDLAIPLKEFGAQKPDQEHNENTRSGTDNNPTVMTTQEIARWIDTKSRAVFPLCFLLFNLMYWTFMFL